MIIRKLLNLTPALFFCAFFQCSNPRLIMPNPSSRTFVEPLKEQKNRQKDKKTPEDIDFGDVFDSSFDSSSNASIQTIDNPLRNSSYRYPSFKVERSRARIALVRNTSSITFYSVGTVDIRTSNNVRPEPFRGIVTAECKKEDDGVALLTASWGSTPVALPCTLLSRNDYNFIEVGQDSYRGSMILISEKKGSISVVNYIDVEEYLRGVVPLELGKRPESEIEALKAQAVAARTYTYRRISERKGYPFDLMCTVADQVYGGANAEYRVSDLAIRLTRDFVLVYRDSLALTYYHSTCGGMTANIEDVWDKPPCNYLRSVNDKDSSGTPYCKISPAFSWQEKWSSSQFSSIVIKSLKQLYPQGDFKGEISDFRIDDIYACGRVKSCTITGSKSKFQSGKDKVRFILRRSTSGNPILRSSRFKVVSYGKKGAVLDGTGYGHGVGMCQMGAVGRAQKGMAFDEILKAYYTGIMICTAIPADRN